MAEIIEGLEAVTVHIRDIERARKFYSGVLGLKEVAYSPEASRAVYAIPGTSTVLTMHVMADGEGGREPGTVSGIVFSNRDPVAACAEIKRRGGTVVNEPVTATQPIGTVTRAVFADPDGNEFLIRHVHR